jgi:hypothetical protein
VPNSNTTLVGKARSNLILIASSKATALDLKPFAISEATTANSGTSGCISRNASAANLIFVLYMFASSVVAILYTFRGS